MKKIVVAICLMFFLILVYYLLMVGISKGFMNDFCHERYCFDFLDLSDFLAISIALIGLVYVIRSLDSWKEQDKFFNARNLCNQLKSLKRLCEVDLLCLINQKEQEILSLPLEKQREALLKIFFELQLFVLSDEISKSLINSNYLYTNDFKEIYSKLNKKLHAMYNMIENEKKSFKNIHGFLHISIRDEFEKLGTELSKINKELNKKANE